MSSPEPILRLHRIAQQLWAVDEEAAAWLSQALAMARLGVSLEAALGLSHGYELFTREQTRSAALRDLGAQAPCQSTNATAAWVARQVATYEGRAWHRDRVTGTRPSGVQGSCFDLMSTGGAPSARTIRRHLALANRIGDLANRSEG